MDSKPLAIAIRGAEWDRAWIDEACGIPIGVDMAAGDDRTVYSINVMAHHAAPHVERIRARIRDHMELYWDGLLVGYLLQTPEQRAMVEEELTKRLNAAADATYVPPTRAQWEARLQQRWNEDMRAYLGWALEQRR